MMGHIYGKQMILKSLRFMSKGVLWLSGELFSVDVSKESYAP